MFTDASLIVLSDMSSVDPCTIVQVYMQEYEGKKRISENLVYSRKLEGFHKTPFIMGLDNDIEVDSQFLKSFTNYPSTVSAEWNSDIGAIQMKAYRRDMSKRDCEEFGEKVYQSLVEFDKQ